MHYLIKVFSLIKERIIDAILAIPSREDWVELLLSFLIYAAIASLLGFRFNFLQVNLLTRWSIAFKIIIISLFLPAILEELLFRVILLPHPSEQVSTINLSSWILISLILFLVSHPINGMTFSPNKKEVFFQPIFLVLAFLLGLVCTILYCNSGSLWTAVIFHWLIVSVWLTCLGGFEQLKINNPT